MSDPEYSGYSACFYKETYGIGGNGSNIVNIRVIPLVGDRSCCICGRLSRLFGLLICKIRKHEFD